MLINWKLLLLIFKKLKYIVNKDVFKKSKYYTDKQGLDKK